MIMEQKLTSLTYGWLTPHKRFRVLDGISPLFVTAEEIYPCLMLVWPSSSVLDQTLENMSRNQGESLCRRYWLTQCRCRAIKRFRLIACQNQRRRIRQAFADVNKALGPPTVVIYDCETPQFTLRICSLGFESTGCCDDYHLIR